MTHDKARKPWIAPKLVRKHISSEILAAVQNSVVEPGAEVELTRMRKP